MNKPLDKAMGHYSRKLTFSPNLLVVNFSLTKLPLLWYFSHATEILLIHHFLTIPKSLSFAEVVMKSWLLREPLRCVVVTVGDMKIYPKVVDLSSIFSVLFQPQKRQLANICPEIQIHHLLISYYSSKYLILYVLCFLPISTLKFYPRSYYKIKNIV